MPETLPIRDDLESTVADAVEALSYVDALPDGIRHLGERLFWDVTHVLNGDTPISHSLRRHAERVASLLSEDDETHALYRSVVRAGFDAVCGLVALRALDLTPNFTDPALVAWTTERAEFAYRQSLDWLRLQPAEDNT